MSSTIFKIVGAGSVLALLSACGGGGGGSLASSPTFASNTGTVNSSNQISTSLSQEANATVSDTDVGLVAFVTGFNGSRGTANAISGIRSGADVGPAQVGGVVTYNSTYRYGVMADVSRTSSTIVGERGTSSAAGITLTGDFGAGTLTGSASDIDVNGTINGQQLGGTVDVDYRLVDIGGNVLSQGSLTTDLQGQIGQDGVIGAFAGKNNNTAIAGGFVGQP